MPQPQHLLEGQVDNRDSLIEELQEQVRALKCALQAAQAEAAHAKRANSQAVAALKHQLSPLYRALQALFGEIEEFDTGAGDPAIPGKVSAVWESWKQRLGGGSAKVIDALLLHSELNTQQLAIAVGLHRTTIPAIIYKLNKAGLINKNGGKFSLKQL